MSVSLQFFSSFCGKRYINYQLLLHILESAVRGFQMLLDKLTSAVSIDVTPALLCSVCYQA